jgi:predicted dehydrogenase
MGCPRPTSALGVAGAKFGPRGQGYWQFAVPREEIYSQYAADDYGCGLIRFENGAALSVESFWACHQAPESQVEIFGTEAGGRLHPLTIYRTVDGAPQDVTVNLPKPPKASRAEGMEPSRFPEGWDAIASHFIECILDGVECSAPLRHGLIVQEMLEAVLESGESGREVRLGDTR